MKKKRNIAIVFATYTLADPTTRNTINSISDLFDTIISVDQNSVIKYKSLESKNVKIISIADLVKVPRLFGIKNIIKWLIYKINVRWLIYKYQPNLMITFMLKPLAAIKTPTGGKLVSCIYDIPDPQTSGKLDSLINIKGFKNLKNADLVWASDEHKSIFTAQFASLGKLPLVCYNCPSLKTLTDNQTSDKVWLRGKLRDSGAMIGENNGTILIRAGAIGKYGGIEETLLAMNEIPEDNLFLMMGRPDKDYRKYLISLIKEMKLEKRAFFWDMPDDNVWQRALSGADIGHLIHSPPLDNTVLAGMYKYNSSLSNYRLFSYMASGIPIFSYNDKRLERLHNDVNCFHVLNIKNLTNEIIEAWRILSEDRFLRDEMGLAAREAFTSKYNWENQFNEIFSFIASPNEKEGAKV